MAERDIFNKKRKETIRGKDFTFRELPYGTIEDKLETVFEIVGKVRDANQGFFERLSETSAKEAAKGKEAVSAADIVQAIMTSLEEVVMQSKDVATTLVTECCSITHEEMRGYPIGVVFQLVRYSLKAQDEAIKDFLSLRSDLSEIFGWDEEQEQTSKTSGTASKSRQRGKRR